MRCSQDVTEDKERVRDRNLHQQKVGGARQILCGPLIAQVGWHVISGLLVPDQRDLYRTVVAIQQYG